MRAGQGRAKRTGGLQSRGEAVLTWSSLGTSAPANGMRCDLRAAQICTTGIWAASRGTRTLARDYVPPLVALLRSRNSDHGKRRQRTKATEDGLGPDGRHGLMLDLEFTYKSQHLARRVQLNSTSYPQPTTDISLFSHVCGWLF